MSTAAAIISVYDGTICIGHIAQRGREHGARSWPSEVDLGTFKTRREAADAISAAHRQACPRAGGERA